VNHPIPQRKGWDGRQAAPYAGPDPFEASRQRAEAEAAKRRAAGQRDEPVEGAEGAAGGVTILTELKIEPSEIP
jgi:hypothetical protein